MVRLTESDQASSRQLLGLPSTFGRGDPPRALPAPNVLLIIPDEDGVLLLRDECDGAFGGDTWHVRVDDAFEQAQIEYGVRPERWREVATTATDEELVSQDCN